LSSDDGSHRLNFGKDDVLIHRHSFTYVLHAEKKRPNRPRSRERENGIQLVRLVLNCTGRLEHAVELPAVVEGEQSPHRSVVAPTHELSVDPDGRDRGPTQRIAHNGADGFPVGILVELDRRVLRGFGIKALLRLDAEGSRREAQHQHRIIGDEIVEPRFDDSLVVLARE